MGVCVCALSRWPRAGRARFLRGVLSPAGRPGAGRRGCAAQSTWAGGPARTGPRPPRAAHPRPAPSGAGPGGAAAGQRSGLGRAVPDAGCWARCLAGPEASRSPAPSPPSSPGPGPPLYQSREVRRAFRHRAGAPVRRRLPGLCRPHPSRSPKAQALGGASDWKGDWCQSLDVSSHLPSLPGAQPSTSEDTLQRCASPGRSRLELAPSCPRTQVWVRDRGWLCIAKSEALGPLKNRALGYEAFQNVYFYSPQRNPF